MHAAPSGSKRSRRRAVLLLAVGAAVLAVVAAGCGIGSPAAGDPVGPAGTAAAGSADPTPSSAAPLDDGVSSVTVVGDSITAGQRSLAEQAVAPPGSWIGGAQGEPLEFRGGWAVPGATTAEMLAGVRPADAEVVVVLAGTNDLVQGVPWDTSARHVRAIVDTVGVDDVLLVAIPPLDSHAAASVEYNLRLAQLADREGWAFVDPWKDFAQGGSYRPGASADGIHPVELVAFAAGRVIRDALLAGAGA